MSTFLVIATFSPETDLPQMNAVIADEVAQVEALRAAGRLGAVHLSPARGAVFLEVQGPCARLDEFGRRLRAEVPPLAAISAVHVVDVAVDLLSDSNFRIIDSQAAAGATTTAPITWPSI